MKQRNVRISKRIDYVYIPNHVVRLDSGGSTWSRLQQSGGTDKQCSNESSAGEVLEAVDGTGSRRSSRSSRTRAGASRAARATARGRARLRARARARSTGSPGAGGRGSGNKAAAGGRGATRGTGAGAGAGAARGAGDICRATISAPIRLV